jgi:hypothetical protein
MSHLWGDKTPRARLKSDDGGARSWVVCHRQTCGFRFAVRFDAAEGILQALDEQVRPPVALEFGHGWRYSDGVWRMSNRAFRRLSENRPPSFRKRPPGATRGQVPMPRPVPYAHIGDSNLADLPALAICPRCSLEQVLDPAVLDADKAWLTSDGFRGTP